MDHEDSLGLRTTKIPQFWVPVDQSMLILGRMISATQGTSRPISEDFISMLYSYSWRIVTMMIRMLLRLFWTTIIIYFLKKGKAVCCIIFLKVRLQFTFESLINNFSLFWGVGTQMLAIGSLFLDQISFLLMFLLYFSWLCYSYWFCQYRYSNWL